MSFQRKLKTQLFENIGSMAYRCGGLGLYSFVSPVQFWLIGPLCSTEVSPLNNRKGVLLGNFVEDLAVEADPHGKTDNFENVTTNREAFRATGKTGHALMEVSTREDVRLKYGKYGKSYPLGDDSGGCFFATTCQLTLVPPTGGRGDQEVGENTIVRKVQECLWSGNKLIDCNVPKSIKLRGLAEARQRKLADAVAKDTYLTIEKVRSLIVS